MIVLEVGDRRITLPGATLGLEPGTYSALVACHTGEETSCADPVPPDDALGIALTLIGERLDAIVTLLTSHERPDSAQLARLAAEAIEALNEIHGSGREQGNGGRSTVIA